MVYVLWLNIHLCKQNSQVWDDICAMIKCIPMETKCKYIPFCAVIKDVHKIT